MNATHTPNNTPAKPQIGKHTLVVVAVFAYLLATGAVNAALFNSNPTFAGQVTETIVRYIHGM
jgi:hypothetical protein